DVLVARWLSDHDPAARDALIERFTPMARRLARRYRSPHEPFDDLFQVACLGLVAAVNRFDPSRGASFPSYAIPTILGELKRHFRNTGWAAHVPRGAQEMALRVERAGREIFEKWGREPTVIELAQYLEASPEEVLRQLDDCGFAPPLLEGLAAGALDAQGHFLCAARDVRSPPRVAKVALELAQDRGDGVAGEARSPVGVKPVDGRHQAEAGDLDEVVEGLVRAAVAPGEPACHRGEPLDQRVARCRVMVAHPASDEDVGYGVLAARCWWGDWREVTVRHLGLLPGVLSRLSGDRASCHLPSTVISGCPLRS